MLTHQPLCIADPAHHLPDAFEFTRVGIHTGQQLVTLLRQLRAHTFEFLRQLARFGQLLLGGEKSVARGGQLGSGMLLLTSAILEGLQLQKKKYRKDNHEHNNASASPHDGQCKLEADTSYSFTDRLLLLLR